MGQQPEERPFQSKSLKNFLFFFFVDFVIFRESEVDWQYTRYIEISATRRQLDTAAQAQ